MVALVFIVFDVEVAFMFPWRYAKEQGIQLVLRNPGNDEAASLKESLDPSAVDPKDKNAVRQQINQHVLYAQGIEEDV